ncbi:MAG: hypothetical protein E7337_11720 [Clostridiales bacterium]|nr:hypothetical protein [Clostridiales bacterium]
MTMKRRIAVWVMILCLAPLGAWAESTEDAIIEVTCGRDGVEEFMAAFALTWPNGIVQKKADNCYDVTPADVARETDIRVFKFSDSGASYAYVDGAVYNLCESFGGYGFLNAMPWDYDQDGQIDLLTASSWGSGIHRTEISVFNRARKTSEVIYSTLYEADPQVDLIVCADMGPSDSGRGASLRQVQVLDWEDGDFAHLRYRIVGEYQPAFPMALHEVPWDASAAAQLLGTWYGEMEGYDMRVGISVTFTADGTVSLRLIDPVSCQYEEAGTAQYRVDGENLTLITNGESVTAPFIFTGEGLVLAIYGMEDMSFRRLSGEELAWMESLQLKYRPGDISQVTIDYGVSERFTPEQMDAAITVIKNEFLNWYGCELHSISYASDERSASEYRYYTGAKRRKTGKNYVDGIVFMSSFHSAAEDEEYPGSGLNPDYEYTGYNWILLQTEEGQWELITWGY